MRRYTYEMAMIHMLKNEKAAIYIFFIRNFDQACHLVPHVSSYVYKTAHDVSMTCPEEL